jgi:diadenosine tetraphosphate (Ap4A) HIT family hydrolase
MPAQAGIHIRASTTMDSGPPLCCTRNDEIGKWSHFRKIEIAPDGKPVQYGTHNQNRLIRSPKMAVQPYDPENIFAKILRGEIPCTKVYEDDHVLAFNDIAPQAPTHVLVIPKGAYTSYDDFALNASDAEIVAYTRAIGKISKEVGVVEDGYRLIANTREHGRQDVPHLHVHILGGEKLPRMLPGA